MIKPGRVDDCSRSEFLPLPSLQLLTQARVQDLPGRNRRFNASFISNVLRHVLSIKVLSSIVDSILDKLLLGICIFGNLRIDINSGRLCA